MIEKRIERQGMKNGCLDDGVYFIDDMKKPLIMENMGMNPRVSMSIIGNKEHLRNFIIGFLPVIL